MRHDVLTRIAVRSCLLGALGAGGLAAQEPAEFVRGDLDQSGRLELTDAVIALRFLFLGEGGRVTCEDAADVDDDGQLAVADPIHLLNGLFHGGPVPARPSACGEDPTEDRLGCQSYRACDFAFTFYGVDFAADGIFLVIDRSLTMQDTGQLERAKREVIRTVDGLHEDTRFGIIFFAANIVKFPEGAEPAMASAEMRDAALSFVQVTSWSSGVCGAAGLHAALDFVEASPARRNEIIYVSDGSGTCRANAEDTYLERTLKEVTERNGGQARIHTIGVLPPFRPGDEFLRALAAQNQGTFTQIR